MRSPAADGVMFAARVPSNAPDAALLTASRNPTAVQRSSGDFARQRSISATRAGGASGRYSRNGCGGADTCFTSIAGVDVASNGKRPASMRYPTMPSEYTSLRPSISRSPVACSGLMNAGVPTAIPVIVRREPPSSARAIPKSVTVARPVSASINTLSGLMSRCTTPDECAYASASATCIRILSTNAMGGRGSRMSRVANVSPLMSDMAKYTRPSRSSTA